MVTMNSIIQKLLDNMLLCYVLNLKYDSQRQRRTSVPVELGSWSEEAACPLGTYNLMTC